MQKINEIDNFHMEPYSTFNKYTCKVCEYSTEYKSNILSHIRRHDNRDIKFKKAFDKIKTKYPVLYRLLKTENKMQQMHPFQSQITYVDEYNKIMPRMYKRLDVMYKNIFNSYLYTNTDEYKKHFKKLDIIF